MNWAEDRFQTPIDRDLRHQTAPAPAPTLRASANNAIAAAFALAGGGVPRGGGAVHLRRPHLSGDRNQDVGLAGFDDADDLLLDITGATGTIATSNFI